MSGDTHLDVLGQAAGHVGCQLVADDGTLFEGQQDRGQTLGAAAKQGWVPTATLGEDTAPPCQLTGGTQQKKQLYLLKYIKITNLNLFFLI